MGCKTDLAETSIQNTSALKDDDLSSNKPNWKAIGK
jgi:hypothetical protein